MSASPAQLWPLRTPLDPAVKLSSQSGTIFFFLYSVKLCRHIIRVQCQLCITVSLGVKHSAGFDIVQWQVAAIVSISCVSQNGLRDITLLPLCLLPAHTFHPKPPPPMPCLLTLALDTQWSFYCLFQNVLLEGAIHIFEFLLSDIHLDFHTIFSWLTS